jgi:hypothetical protein
MTIRLHAMTDADFAWLLGDRPELSSLVIPAKAGIHIPRTG